MRGLSMKIIALLTQGLLRLLELPVIEAFAQRREFSDGLRLQEGVPIRDAFLPDAALLAQADAFQEDEAFAEQAISSFCLLSLKYL